MQRVYVINGPNLNLLGIREPDIYGKTSLRDIIVLLKKHASERGIKIRHFQSNSEGKLIDKIQTISAAPLLGEAILRIHNEESISSLFDT